jgi:regulator of protease activity HflC (stomatin/prohibitin superfamily)
MLPETKPAGLRFVFWPIEKLYRIPLRIETLDVPPQDIITRDNVSVKVNAVCYFRVVDANLALAQVQNYRFATSQKAQTTLRSIVGQFELDEILAARDKVNTKLQAIIDQDTEPWYQGNESGSQTGGYSGDNAASHRAAGGGRTRASRQDHSRLRRI